MPEEHTNDAAHGSTGLVCGWLLLGLAACANTHASDAAQARPVAKPITKRLAKDPSRSMP